MDLATATGWAYGRVPPMVMTPIEAARHKPPKPLSGVQRFGHPKCSLGYFLHDAERWAFDTFARFSPKAIIIEAPILDPKITGYDTARKLMALAGLMLKCAHQADIRWIEEGQPSTVKKHFSGSGRKGKELVQQACAARGWAFIDDNEADSLALWDYGCQLLVNQRQAQYRFPQGATVADAKPCKARPDLAARDVLAGESWAFVDHERVGEA